MNEFVRLIYLPALGVVSTGQFEGVTMSTRSKEKAIELRLTRRFMDRVISLPWEVVNVVLEVNMEMKLRDGEVKGGDSVIVDLDSDGKLVFLGGTSGAPPDQLDELVVG